MKILMLVFCSLVLISCGKNANVAIKGDSGQRSALLGSRSVNRDAALSEGGERDRTSKPSRERGDRELSDPAGENNTEISQRELSDCPKDIGSKFKYVFDGDVNLDKDRDKDKIEDAGLKVTKMTYSIYGKYCERGYEKDLKKTVISGEEFDIPGKTTPLFINLELDVEAEVNGHKCSYTLKGAHF